MSGLLRCGGGSGGGKGYARVADQRRVTGWCRRWLLVAGICLVAGLVLLGCTRGAPGQADLVVLNGKEPESLDPVIFSGEAEGRLAMALFEGLTRYNPTNGLAEPGLADRWEVSADGRRYRFHLREGARWSTGEPIVATDVEWSWLRMIDPWAGSDYAGPFFYIRGAREYSTHTNRNVAPLHPGFRAVERGIFEVELSEPTPFFLELCASAQFVVVPRKAVESGGDGWLKQRPLPCSGAFELLEWRINDRIRMRRNDRYWDALRTGSGIVDLLPVSNPVTALNLFLSGEADVVWDKELVPAELVDVLRRRGDFHGFDYLATYFIRMNVERGPLRDARVRRALGLVLNRRHLVERITRGGEKPAVTLVPPVLEGYTAPQVTGEDAELGRRLLREAGYAGGAGFPTLRYHYFSSRTQEAIAVELQAMWRRELGIQVELRPEEWQVYLRTQSSRDYDLSRSSWVGDYNDPTTFLDLFLSDNTSNRTGWRNAEYDRVMGVAAREADPVRRLARLREAERFLVEQEAPVVPVYFLRGLESYDAAKVTGIHQNPRAEHPLRAVRRGAVMGGGAAQTE